MERNEEGNKTRSRGDDIMFSISLLSNIAFFIIKVGKRGLVEKPSLICKDSVLCFRGVL